jgi:hypothetical protein
VKLLVTFLRFWWDFVVGDDWLVAVGIVVALGLTALLTDHGTAAWWLMPLAALLLLGVSLLRATRSSLQ